MARPVLLVLDPDPPALADLVGGLTRRFGNDFDVRGSHSEDAAVATLEALAASGDDVALVLADDSVSEAFAARAHELHPDARRVLLVHRDYTTTSAAVQAIALGRADFHIVRPWGDDESMYRAMSEYLASWTRERQPGFEEFRVVADADDGRTLRLCDVMRRFSLPFGFYDAASDAGRRLLETAGLDAPAAPVVIRYDGHVMVDPDLPDLARAIGVQVDSDVDACDLAIVGAGPAGLTAAVYAASEGLETVLLELAVSGGQAGTSPLIRNYPGFPHGINGGTLMERTCEQAWLMGAHIVFAQEAVGLEQDGEWRVVRLRGGTGVRARAVVIATGMAWRRLGVPELEALVGAGVHYGAAVGESRAMEGQDVCVVGAGNSAGQAALHLARHARTVTLLVRGDDLRASMSSYLIRAIEATPNITVRLSTQVIGGEGNERLRRLRLADRATGRVTERATAALFVMIGGEPHTQWLPAEIMRDERGYLLTGRDARDAGRDPLPLETSMPGVFAAGDVRHGSIRRVASAVGDGATVVRLVHDYLRDLEASATGSPAG